MTKNKYNKIKVYIYNDDMRRYTRPSKRLITTEWAIKEKR